MHDCIRKAIKLLNDYLINCKSFQKHHSITKWLPNNYPPVIVMHDSLRTRTDRPDLPILKKRWLVLPGHISFVEYKFDCISFI